MSHPRSPVLVHHAFTRQAEAHPSRVAIALDDARLTYAELSRRARHLAARLRTEGVGPDGVVAVGLERSPELVVGLLGVLMAGGSYLPLDPDYPARRLAFMMADADVRVLLTRAGLRGTLPAPAGPTLSLDEVPPASPSTSASPVKGPAPNPDHLAYVIHTSGSTGRPKGAMNTHRALANRLAWMQDAYRLTSSDRVLHKTSIGFDVSVWELLWPLVAGASLVLARPGGHRDPAYLVDLIRREGVTTLHFVPSMLRAFLATPGVEECTSIRRVICSGEELRPDLAGRFFALLPEARLHNLYGPTEAAIDVTAWACRPEESTRIPIGTPITNVSAHVMNDRLEPVGVGVAGELFVGGVALARGYLGRPGLTAERFVPDPVSGEPGARLYRTGDRARWRTDGALEFLGRLDEQVKIRGVRVEPGETESVLAEHDGVAQVAVVAGTDEAGGQRLVAYAVPDPRGAGPVAGLLRMERTEAPVEARRHDLPDGRTVLVPSQGEAEFVEHEIFDPARYAALGIELRPGGCVVDAGAHVGLFTLYADRAREGGTTYAFEPIPPLFELLRRNTAMHGAGVRVFPWALGEQEGETAFTHYPNLSIMSGRYADPGRDRDVVRAYLRNRRPAATGEDLDAVAEQSLTARRYTCRIRRLSDVLRELGVGRVDLLKIDVERSEEQVIAGLDAGDWPRIRQVLVEVHDTGGRLERLTDALSERGFQVRHERDPLLAGTDLVMLAGVRPDSGRHRPEPAAHTGVDTGLDTGLGTGTRWASPARLVADLRRHARQMLPDAMVPSAFVLLDEFPLTPSGKLDRRALPAPPSRSEVTAAWTAPEGAAQERLAAIWTELLGVDRPGADDDFFELGGHSLLANRLVARVRTAFDAELPLDRVFTARTIRGVAEEVAAAPPAGQAEPDIRPVPRDGDLPLSFAQERLWFLLQLHPGIRSYQFQATLAFTGPLDRTALAAALTEVVRRHEIYRTTFAEGDEGPVQVIHAPFPADLPLDDLGDRPAPGQAARDVLREEFAGQIAADRLPLVRWRLLRLGPDRHVLVHVEHHLVHDGWAFNVFLAELAALYAARLAGRPSPLAEPDVQFADFAVWQRSWLDGPESGRQLAYWRKALDGVAPVLDLPTDRPRPALRRFLGDAPRIDLPAEVADRLRALARTERATLFMTMLAAFGVLLRQWSGQEDFCVGSGIANRRQRQSEQLLGMVINTVALRVDLRGDPSFQELVARVRTTTLGAYAHQDVPFERVVAAMRPERILGVQPLCQAMFSFHDAPLRAVWPPGLGVEATEGLANGSAKFDLNVIAIPRAEQLAGRSGSPADGGIVLIWEYDSDLFDAATMARMAEDYRRLLDAVTTDPLTRVSDLEVPRP